MASSEVFLTTPTTSTSSPNAEVVGTTGPPAGATRGEKGIRRFRNRTGPTTRAWTRSPPTAPQQGQSPQP